MPKIDNYLAFVKEQVEVQHKLARKVDDPYRKTQHRNTAKSFSDLADFLREIQANGTNDTSYLYRGDSPQKRISLTYEDIDGAPDELIKELSLTEADRQDLLMEYLIAQAGGVLSLDKIIIELYKRLREIPKRSVIIARLYRMVGKGMIYAVPGKKGVYSTYEMTEQDAKKMFGQTDGEPEDQAASPAPPTAPAAPPVSPSKATSTSHDKFKAELLNSSAGSSFRRG